MLDFYSCADCGRCSDQCPANAVGRPLSPRFLTIKARDYAFQHYPVFGRANNGTPLIGGDLLGRRDLVLHHLRRLRSGMPAAGRVHRQDRRPAARHGGRRQGAAVAAEAAEGPGEPRQSVRQDGEEEGRLGEGEDFQRTCQVRILNGDRRAERLYFVDSITSYDDRMQSIGRATAQDSRPLGEDFGILGAAEKDSGHEVRRFGEETLFMALRDHNVGSDQGSPACGGSSPPTRTPINALKHDSRTCRRWSTSAR